MEKRFVVFTRDIERSAGVLLMKHKFKWGSITHRKQIPMDTLFFRL